MARRVRDVMTPTPDCCTPDDSVVEVARVMEQRDVGVVPIVESQETRRIVGVVTDRDLILRVVSQGRDPNVVVSVREVMTPEVVTCAPEDELATAEALMKTHQVRRIVVTDEHGAVVGILSTGDLARAADEAAVGETVKKITEP